MKILFLYTELAGYFLACINELKRKVNCEIHVVRWPVNEEAPFSFSFDDKIKIYDRKKYSSDSLLKLSSDIAPDIIYCSGWIDKDYLLVCRQFRKNIPVIVGFDNKWTGSLKQRFASALSRFTIQHHFSHCWIPGNPQLEFAKRMGFKEDRILSGFYSCDYNMFHALFEANREKKQLKFPHRFIFAGRYYEFKGIKNLWQAFSEIEKEFCTDWELWCLGTGDIKPVIHSRIRHFGFVQPHEMPEFIEQTGVFILPSTFEPWGVAVHEFAAAGFPLILSDEVGAAEKFLKEGENGFLFESGNIAELKKCLRKIIFMSNAELLAMGEKSAELAKQITPDSWVDALMSVLK